MFYEFNVLRMSLYKILLLLIFLLLANCLSAQVQVNVTVLSGNALTDCEDAIGQPDPVWSVNINNQGWFDYIQDSNCPIFYNTPNLQFITTYGCPLDAQNELELCFRAYENDPGLLTPCNVSPDNCIEEVCARFPIPAAGNAATYTLSLPNEGTAKGQVEFQIATVGQFPGGLNDVPCTAIDLGVLPSGGKIGDVTQGLYNNYCGTISFGEPNPATSLAPWENDNGVWYSFTTPEQPSQK
ncbi:MAG: hypothetical protein HC892_04675 [Saprospiraceae bacterium]|nr:hypothetical protein [Saprospiraceae bacterium]